MSVRLILFLFRNHSWSPAGPEGTFQGLLQLGARYSSNVKSSKYNLKMAMTTLKALGAVHLGGEMAAKTAML